MSVHCWYRQVLGVGDGYLGGSHAELGRAIMYRVSIALVASVSLVVVACGGGSADTTTSSQATTTSTTVSATTTTTAAPTTTIPEVVTQSEGDLASTTTTTTPAAEDPPPEDIPLTDLLTFARGALFVSQTGLSTGSAASVLRMIDGDPQILGVSSDANPEVEVLYKMPANTTFDRFAIPNVIESPGNVTFYKNITISGSLEGPDSAFQVLAAFELETHADDMSVTEIIPEIQTPVRWVRVHFEGGINIEEGDEGKTVLEFTELIGNGTQDDQELSTAFDGVWDFRLTERQDLRGDPLELHQMGATVTGCLDTMVLTGTVNGRIARLNGFDPTNDDTGRFIMVADDDGSISAVYSVNGRVFDARSAVIHADTTETPCSEDPPMPTACGTAVYINFDYNSATIRSESEQALADLYENLLADGVESVSIEGHTSTEGSEAYNLDLSNRRAQSVVDDLVSRGYDAGAITAVGFGETNPLISPDNDETSRELNRRVEVNCG